MVWDSRRVTTIQRHVNLVLIFCTYALIPQNHAITLQEQNFLRIWMIVMMDSILAEGIHPSLETIDPKKYAALPTYIVSAWKRFAPLSI